MLDGWHTLRRRLCRQKRRGGEIRRMCIGEVRLLSKHGAFWPQFEIRAYSAGEKVEQILPWSHEPNWFWSAQNRRDAAAGSDAFSVAYRGLARRCRFVRIVNTGPASDAKLAGIEVFRVAR